MVGVIRIDRRPYGLFALSGDLSAKGYQRKASKSTRLRSPSSIPSSRLIEAGNENTSPVGSTSAWSRSLSERRGPFLAVRIVRPMLQRVDGSVSSARRGCPVRVGLDAVSERMRRRPELDELCEATVTLCRSEWKIRSDAKQGIVSRWVELNVEDR